jgi:hypothetical protein
VIEAGKDAAAIQQGQDGLRRGNDIQPPCEIIAAFVVIISLPACKPEGLPACGLSLQ